MEFTVISFANVSVCHTAVHSQMGEANIYYKEKKKKRKEKKKERKKRKEKIPNISYLFRAPMSQLRQLVHGVKHCAPPSPPPPPRDLHNREQLSLYLIIRRRYLKSIRAP